eukprot:6632227-Pyramimonas_sp.AAC.1
MGAKKFALLAGEWNFTLEGESRRQADWGHWAPGGRRRARALANAGLRCQARWNLPVGAQR